MDQVFVGCLLLVMLVGYLVAYIHPVSRPYARKYSALFMALLFAGLGFFMALLLLRSGRVRPGQPVPTIPGSPTFSQLHEQALVDAAQADADLARRRLETRKGDMSAKMLAEFDAERRSIQRETDLVQRRRRLIRLVEAAR